MVSKISWTVVISSSWHRHAISRRVPPGNEMLELPLDVGQQRTGTEPEQVVAQPAVAELLLHQVQVLERRLRRADSSGWLEANGVAGAVVILADHSAHDEGKREQIGRAHV